jgi:hypothetical protein
MPKPTEVVESWQLGARIMKAGIFPPDFRITRVQLLVKATGLAKIRFDVIATPEMLRALGAALPPPPPNSPKDPPVPGER